MAPKKKAEKKKGGDDDGDNPAQMNAALDAAVESLKIKLVLEQERKDKSLSSEHDVQENEKVLLDSLSKQKSETKECVEEMTKQYKEMENRL